MSSYELTTAKCLLRRNYQIRCTRGNISVRTTLRPPYLRNINVCFLLVDLNMKKKIKEICAMHIVFIRFAHQHDFSKAFPKPVLEPY